MEKGEPTFVPEWLKNSGNVDGGGSSTHHLVSSHSDVPSLANPNRNRSFKGISDFDGPRSSVLERTASSNSRRNSNSIESSVKHPYSSFGRSHRDKEKERSVGGSRWDFDPLDDMMNGRTMRDMLRPTRSMVTGKHSVSTNGAGVNHYNGNGAISVGGIANSSFKKAVFDKDFPSLGTEDIGRVPSPGLATAIQSLPVVNSALLNGDGWSALAEVPVTMGSNGVGVKSTASATTSAVPVSTGLNMAEALVQAPTRSRTAPQMLNSSDKLKPKTISRTSEMAVGPKNGYASQPFRDGQVKSEPPKTSSKFLVLKPMRENVSKDSPSPTSTPSNISGSNPLAAHPVSSVPRSPNNPNLPVRKSTLLPLNVGPAAEKRPLSQAKSRNEFFNSVRKKSSVHTSSVPLEEEEKSGEAIKDQVATSDSSSGHVIENGELASNGNASEEGENGYSPNAVYPDEEEAAFLRSLGWNENDAGEDEGGLTEEEINSFYQECLASRASLKICQSLQPKLSMLSAAKMDGAEASSSG